MRHTIETVIENGADKRNLIDGLGTILFGDNLPRAGNQDVMVKASGFGFSLNAGDRIRVTVERVHSKKIAKPAIRPVAYSASR